MFNRDPSCLVVVDKREQEHLDISYSVLMDDTVIESGDIPVSDAKTHQFFALTGTIYAVGIDDFYVPFTDLKGTGTVFPLWVTHKDVQRSAAAVEMATGVTAEQTDLPPARVLESRPDFDWELVAHHSRRRAPSDHGHTIVRTRALDARGRSCWRLHGDRLRVQSTLQRVGAAARRDKVVDADHNPAAGAIKPVNEVVFAYQGRRVRGCVDVPEETRLDAYYFVEEKPAMGWNRG